MRVISLSELSAAVRDDSAARDFEREGMLIAECESTGRFVADRKPMRGRSVFNRYQLVSADQTEVAVFRSRRAAIAALRS